MRRWLLTRTYLSPLANLATIGILSEDVWLAGYSHLDRPFIIIEPLWHQNQENASCVPEGTYNLAWRTFPQHGRRLWVRDTSPRTDILFHAGNFQKDTHGCLLPNLRFGIANNQPRGYESQKALALIEATVAPEEEIELIITHYHPA